MTPPANNMADKAQNRACRSKASVVYYIENRCLYRKSDESKYV